MVCAGLAAWTAACFGLDGLSGGASAGTDAASNSPPTIVRPDAAGDPVDAGNDGEGGPVPPIQGDCPDGQGLCSEQCVDVAAIPNCGACGEACAGVINVEPSQRRCAPSRTCGYSGACSAGFADCDGNPINGCESDFESAASCGTTCQNRRVCAAACSAGACATVKKIAIGGSHVCILLSDATLRCHGSNSQGQLGDGTTIDHLRVPRLPTLRNVVDVATGNAHTCVVLQGGDVRCWGDNQFGQLGNGAAPTDSIQIPTTGVLSGAKAVSAGFSHTCALTTGDDVKCWGAGNRGQIGNGTTTSQNAPAANGVTGNTVEVVSGAFHNCARKATAVLCWGANDGGQIGNKSRIDRLEPDSANIPLPQGVSVGQAHTCAIGGFTGVRCWGRNAEGQLGDGSTNDRLEPPSFGVLTNSVQLATGALHTCALGDDGSVRCWGSNAFGQLGLGGGNFLQPPQQPVLTNARAIFAGSSTTCAVLRNEQVRCWGQNQAGQVGDGTQANRDAPTALVF
jgi:alpha-tubulin suppressor-like RCC1 family protein